MCPRRCQDIDDQANASRFPGAPTHAFRAIPPQLPVPPASPRWVSLGDGSADPAMGDWRLRGSKACGGARQGCAHLRGLRGGGSGGGGGGGARRGGGWRARGSAGGRRGGERDEAAGAWHPARSAARCPLILSQCNSVRKSCYSKQGDLRSGSSSDVVLRGQCGAGMVPGGQAVMVTLGRFGPSEEKAP